MARNRRKKRQARSWNWNLNSILGQHKRLVWMQNKKWQHNSKKRLSRDWLMCAHRWNFHLTLKDSGCDNQLDFTALNHKAKTNGLHATNRIQNSRKYKYSKLRNWHESPQKRYGLRSPWKLLKLHVDSKNFGSVSVACQEVCTFLVKTHSAISRSLDGQNLEYYMHVSKKKMLSERCEGIGKSLAYSHSCTHQKIHGWRIWCAVPDAWPSKVQVFFIDARLDSDTEQGHHFQLESRFSHWKLQFLARPWKVVHGGWAALENVPWEFTIEAHRHKRTGDIHTTKIRLRPTHELLEAQCVDLY